MTFFSSNLVKLDLDLDPYLHSEKQLDPDRHKMNADPQPAVWSSLEKCGKENFGMEFRRNSRFS